MEKVLEIVWDWLIPIAFIVCVGWCIWHTPAFLLDFIPPENQSLFDQMSRIAFAEGFHTLGWRIVWRLH